MESLTIKENLKLNLNFDEINFSSDFTWTNWWCSGLIIRDSEAWLQYGNRFNEDLEISILAQSSRKVDRHKCINLVEKLHFIQGLARFDVRWGLSWKSI